MMIYLTEWTIKPEYGNGNTAYKIGITKYGPKRLFEERFPEDPNKRGYDERHAWFDKRLLANIMYSHDSYQLAAAATFGIEAVMQAVCPKKFQLEEHFELNEEYNFDKFGGITEWFKIEDSNLTIEQVIEVFDNLNNRLWVMDNNIKSIYGKNKSTMEDF